MGLLVSLLVYEYVWKVCGSAFDIEKCKILEENLLQGEIS